MLNSKRPRFKSLLHHLQLFGLLNYHEPLESEALNAPPQGNRGKKRVVKAHDEYSLIELYHLKIYKAS